MSELIAIEVGRRVADLGEPEQLFMRAVVAFFVEDRSDDLLQVCAIFLERLQATQRKDRPRVAAATSLRTQPESFPAKKAGGEGRRESPPRNYRKAERDGVGR